MNVDIDWIKQRPHFLAEELSKKYDMTLFYPYFYNRKVLKRDKHLNFISKRIYRVPNRVSIKWLHRIIDAYNSRRIKQIIEREKPDILFFTDPTQIDYVSEKFKGLVIYDCMDDLVALAPNKLVRERVLSKERAICSRADIITVTSQELMKVVGFRYGEELSQKFILSRNAFGGQIENDTVECVDNAYYTMCYFGTISTWFDFKMLESSLNKFDNIKYVLIGPVVEGINIPNNDRIEYLGIKKHEELARVVEKVDCFIMPFMVNDIIKSVDPVKMYEYINYKKNIISIYYNELSRFDPFVFFYTDEDSFNIALSKAMKSELKYTDKERVNFLNENSWQSRAAHIIEMIDFKIGDNS